MDRDIYLLSPLVKKDTISLPMIEFTQTADSIDFSTSNTLIFTSKQAVVTANNIDKNWQKYPSIAIGGATKSKIEELGGDVIYYPKKFYGKNLSDDIKEFFSDKKLLYLRPKTVSFDMLTYLKNENLNLTEQIIYKTDCISYKKNKKPAKNSIIIFTSPSTIKCFLNNFSWDNSYIAVVIGEATKKFLPQNAKVKVADEALINSCIKKALEIKL
jgi:uroporphyrinogen-III synthase